MTGELSQKVKKADRASYSKLDTVEACPYKFKLKYIDKYYSDSKTIALEVGKCLHKVLELKGKALLQHNTVDYAYLENVLFEGFADGKERIVGIKEIKKRYFDKWFEPDNASGMNYEQKLELFLSEVLEKEMEGCEVIAVEMPFEFIYCYSEGKEIILHGFIDRVDRLSDGGFKVIDYKTSKKVYEPSKLATPLQHVIYGLACYDRFGILPEKYEYDFILLDQKQSACTKGYLKRGMNRLDKLLNQMDRMKEQGRYPAKASPLCYWCEFHGTSPNADTKFKGMCDFYCLWTPENKTFRTKKRPLKIQAQNKKERGRLIF